jgi:hypothetical protein
MIRPFWPAIASIVLLVTAAAACADVLQLTGGGRIEGIVTDNGDSYDVRTTGGMCTVAKSQVKLIEKSETVIEKYEKAAKDVRDDDIEGRFRLAMICKEGNWTGKMREELGRVLKLDPSHEQAHTELGHELVDGKWMTRDEAMAAKGYVKFESKWVPQSYVIDVEQWKEKVRIIKKQETKLNETLKRLCSSKAAVRDKALPEFVAAASAAGVGNPEKLGQAIKDNYAEAWAKYFEVSNDRVVAEVRATDNSNVNMRTLDIVPAAGTPPDVNIQLPWAQTMRVQSTGIIPVRTTIRLVTPPRPELAK